MRFRGSTCHGQEGAWEGATLHYRRAIQVELIAGDWTAEDLPLLVHVQLLPRDAAAPVLPWPVQLAPGVSEDRVGCCLGRLSARRAAQV